MRPALRENTYRSTPFKSVKYGLKHTTLVEQRVDFEGRLIDSEQRELERQQALLQFQQSILALVNESLVRIESLAVAERLRFEAQLRSAESSLPA